MKSYQEKESACEAVFRSFGQCWHLWTPADFEIIFRNDEDFRAGMNIIGVCVASMPDVTMLTYEIMSNHLHLCVAGTMKCLLALFERIKETLRRHFKCLGRNISWQDFSAGIRELKTLKELRTVIIYINRNGYVVHQDCSPFTYPWGANRYFFNPDAKTLALTFAKNISLRERRLISHSRMADAVEGLRSFEGCALPLSFCTIGDAEAVFRDESNYFFRLGKCVEANKDIADEIKDSVFYNDDELFSAICQISRERFGTGRLTQLSPVAKLELAKRMHYDYNASSKQIIRFLKLTPGVLESIGIR